MKLSVFNIKISLISTTRLAGEERIKEILDLETLPADVRPLLRQEVLPSEALAPLGRQKSRAMRLLLKHATHNPLGGWNVGTGCGPVLLDGLKEIQTAFYAAKQDLLVDLQSIFDDHLSELRQACADAGYKHTDVFIDAVRAAQPSSEYLDRQIRFEYLSPRIVTYDDPEEIKIVRDGVYGQALHEIAQRALEASRAKAIKSRLRAIDEIAEKFDGLSYIEPRLGAISSELTTALGGVPRSLREVDYPPLQGMAVAHALSRLSDEDGLAAAVDRKEPLFLAPADDNDGLLSGLEAVPAVRTETTNAEPADDVPADEQGDDGQPEPDSLTPRPAPAVPAHHQTAILW